MKFHVPLKIGKALGPPKSSFYKKYTQEPHYNTNF